MNHERHAYYKAIFSFIVIIIILTLTIAGCLIPYYIIKEYAKHFSELKQFMVSDVPGHS